MPRATYSKFHLIIEIPNIPLFCDLRYLNTLSHDPEQLISTTTPISRQFNSTSNILVGVVSVDVRLPHQWEGDTVVLLAERSTVRAETLISLQHSPDLCRAQGEEGEGHTLRHQFQALVLQIDCCTTRQHVSITTKPNSTR